MARFCAELGIDAAISSAIRWVPSCCSPTRRRICRCCRCAAWW
ncbi:hypothetical protein I552_2165 [Mycobacterium xenopi 3993]|nr:hypothetical protein I552_2165 [Mycobacterium xenopi 3993]